MTLQTKSLTFKAENLQEEKDLIGFVSMVSDMATAFDMSAEVAGDAMAKLANVWNKPIQEMSQFGDMINLISNNTPAKASQIVEALGRIGGTAKAFGLSEQGAVSLTSAMIGLGKAPDVASRAINHLLSELSVLDVHDKSVSASLKQLRFDASEFGNRLKTDAEGALFSFIEAMNKLPKDEQIGFSMDLFGKNFGDDILALATAPELLTKIRDLLADSANYTGSMTKEAEVLSATTEGQIKKFQNNISILKASIGTAFLPALTSIMDKLTPIIGAMSEWANENPSTDEQNYRTALWYIEQKVSETNATTTFELSNPVDFEGLKIPVRQITSYCHWAVCGRYRMEECGYLGTARFTHDGKPTDNPELDKCGGRLSDCKLRNNERRFGGFPASSLVG